MESNKKVFEKKLFDMHLGIYKVSTLLGCLYIVMWIIIV